MTPMRISDVNDRAIEVNDSFCDMLGYTRDELLGRKFADLIHPEDREITRASHESLVSRLTNQVNYVNRYLRKDGQIVVTEVSRITSRDSSRPSDFVISSERDITDDYELTSKLSFQATHDPLTGLANRVVLEDRLNQARARVQRSAEKMGVFVIDLDDFKSVNDSYGHLLGDQLLRAVCERLTVAARPSDILCCFGGDEFVYVAEGLKEPREAEHIAQRFLAALREPFHFANIKLIQCASIGIVISDGDGSASSALMQDADAALYEAKRQSKGSYRIFDSSKRNLVASRLELRQDLDWAADHHELTMHYQPIVQLDTHEVVGFEALMRWRHPLRGLIGPDIFMPLAEKSDTILKLGEFALREATSVASSWGRSGAGILPYVAINLSTQQLRDPLLVDVVDEVLLSSGLEPDRLIFEITEDVALSDFSGTCAVLRALRSRGVDIALDNFGIGYSSLTYLTEFGPRLIKIDRSFVSAKNSNEQNQLLLESIISQGQKMNAKLSAEGIETLSQRDRLLKLGCRLGQGHLYSKALTATEVHSLLSDSNVRMFPRGSLDLLYPSHRNLTRESKSTQE